VKILLVEDDRELADGLAAYLRLHGYAVDHLGDGVEADFAGRDESYDAIVLDLGLPGRSGLEVLTRWRQGQVTTPVLILTARDTWGERVAGLRAGADDYLGKPFHREELLARLEALLRRRSGRANATLQLAGLELDEDRQQVRIDGGEAVPLTGTEFRLLRYLMAHPDSILSKWRLTEHVYEQDHDRDSNVIEVYIRRLREKIGQARIETRRGQGYVFRSR
jgi:two-component system, OmpR family, response regulator